MNYLREPSTCEYPRLLQRATQCLPYSTSVVGALEVISHPEIPRFQSTKIWIPNEPESLPFFIVITKTWEFQSLVLYWERGLIKHDTLIILLSSLPEFDWKKFIRVHTVDEDVLNELEILLASERLSGVSLKRFIREQGYVLACHPESLPSQKLPAGYQLKSLSAEYSKFVEDHWEYANDNARGIVEFTIKYLGSSAVFTEDPEANGQPVSWALFKIDSQIGATYTNPKYRGNKLASTVTVDLCKKILKKGFHPYVLVADENTVSTKLHENLGFKKTSRIGWEYYVPIDRNSVPENMKHFLPKEVTKKVSLIN